MSEPKGTQGFGFKMRVRNAANERPGWTTKGKFGLAWMNGVDTIAAGIAQSSATGLEAMTKESNGAYNDHDDETGKGINHEESSLRKWVDGYTQQPDNNLEDILWVHDDANECLTEWSASIWSASSPEVQQSNIDGDEMEIVFEQNDFDDGSSARELHNLFADIWEVDYRKTGVQDTDEKEMEIVFVNECDLEVDSSTSESHAPLTEWTASIWTDTHPESDVQDEDRLVSGESEEQVVFVNDFDDGLDIHLLYALGIDFDLGGLFEERLSRRWDCIGSDEDSGKTATSLKTRGRQQPPTAITV